MLLPQQKSEKINGRFELIGEWDLGKRSKFSFNAFVKCVNETFLKLLKLLVVLTNFWKLQEGYFHFKYNSRKNK